MMSTLVRPRIRNIPPSTLGTQVQRKTSSKVQTPHWCPEILQKEVLEDRKCCVARIGSRTPKNPFMPIAQIASWPVRNIFNERIDNSFTHYTSFSTNHKRKWKWRIENCKLSSHLTSVPSPKPSVWGELLCCCLRLTPVLPGNVSLLLWYMSIGCVPCSLKA